ncbi:DUF167 domain-containing protein [Candidatus Omnitrophota bacterium]
MVLSIRAIPKASRNLVKKESDRYKVYVTAPAQDGLANEKIKKLLADYFKVKSRQVTIVKGKRSRDKLVRIDVPAKKS